MKILGMVGGIAPESTIDYYRRIISLYRERRGNYPRIIINSIDMNTMLDFVGAGDLGGLSDFLVEEVKRLAAAGAQIGLLASNTPHMVFEAVSKGSPIPLISIVETACETAGAMHIKRAGLFGTRFTMRGGFYNGIFSREGISIVVPEDDEQEYIQNIYMNELVNGIFLPATRARLLEIALRMKRERGIQALILGGTELPLILRDHPKDFPFLDTTDIHAKSAVARLLS
jgi:aspartate racemase